MLFLLVLLLLFVTGVAAGIIGQKQWGWKGYIPAAIVAATMALLLLTKNVHLP